MTAPFFFVSFFFLLTSPCFAQVITTINKNDPCPVFTSADPNDYLTRDQKNKFIENEQFISARFRFSASPFLQKASTARNFNKVDTPIGDLRGRWNMLALLYPATNTNGTLNTDIQNGLITQLGLNTFDADCLSFITTPTTSDTNKQFGFFSVPINYQKYGVRFHIDALLTNDIGLLVQTGAVDIKQTATFIDLTCSAKALECAPHDCTTVDDCVDAIPAGCRQAVMDKIMKERHTVAELLELSTSNFEKRSMEDVYASLYWRHSYAVNQKLQDWPLFYCTPYVTLNASFPTASCVSPRCLFALPAGNNGHYSGGFNAGVTLDFVETLEIGIEAGMAYFSERTYKNFPVPTSIFNAGMYPYQATIALRPGTNWNFSAIINAYHFLDRLSAYVQYVLVNHGTDHFRIKKIQTPNAVLVPNPSTATPEIECALLTKYSRFEVQVLNIGLNYDISPNIALGFFWQAPLSRMNAYRSTTVMGSLVATF